MIARNSDWIIALSASVVNCRSNHFVLVFWQSSENRSTIASRFLLTRIYQFKIPINLRMLKCFLREEDNDSMIWTGFGCSGNAHAFMSFPIRVYAPQGRQNNSTLKYISHLINKSNGRTERCLASRKGICHKWSRGRHFSPSLHVREARYLKTEHAQAESDLRAEISGSIVKVQRSGSTSRGTVTRFTFLSSVYACAQTSSFHCAEINRPNSRWPPCWFLNCHAN